MGSEVAAAVGCVFGVVIGFGAGWYLRPKYSTFDLEQGLSKEAARQVIDQRYLELDDPKLECRILNVEAMPKEALVFNAYTELTERCFRDLQKAAIIAPGECVDTQCPSGCCRWRISPGTNGALSDDGLMFRCGNYRVQEVKSITTKGNEAKVKFARELAPNEAMRSVLKDCSVQAAQSGSVDQSWELERDDDGYWQVVSD
jgi:hypothetical protein